MLVVFRVLNEDFRRLPPPRPRIYGRATNISIHFNWGGGGLKFMFERRRPALNFEIYVDQTNAKLESGEKSNV